MLNTKKKKILVLLAVLMLVLVAFAAVKIYSSKNNNANKPAETINFNPPTEQEVKAAEDHKQEVVSRIDQEKNYVPPQQGTSTPVTPVITYAGQYGSDVEVGGYAPGVFEDGGTCEATFSNGSRTLNKSVSAVKGSNSVDCPVMALPVSDFPVKGSWKVTIKYSSAKYSGVSEPKMIEVK